MPHCAPPFGFFYQVAAAGLLSGVLLCGPTASAIEAATLEAISPLARYGTQRRQNPQSHPWVRHGHLFRPHKSHDPSRALRHVMLSERWRHLGIVLVVLAAAPLRRRWLQPTCDGDDHQPDYFAPFGDKPG